MASYSVYRLVETKHSTDALELYDRYREHDAELTGSDGVRLYVADALVELHCREQALRLLREIVATGEPKHRRRAEERLRELEGGAAR